MSDLPYIDAHETVVRAPPELVWDAVAEVAGHWGGRFGPVAARALGCTDTRSDFPRTVVGFHVSRADRPRLIRLEGNHRFSRYALEFSVQPGGSRATRLCAESSAEFPGVQGKLYQALVIGTGGHAAAMSRLLSAIKRRAQARSGWQSQ